MTAFIRAALIFLFSLGSISHGIAATDKTVDIGDGVVLHYIEQGSGPTVIFAHGSLSDYSYWEDQIGQFSDHYHVIAYSRRYNPPNDNAERQGYSAITDSDDLAAMIKKLNLGKVYLIGHSYGAFAGLFLAARHPEVLRAAVLAEPPAMSLLLNMPPDQAAAGKRSYADAQLHMVKPMTTAFIDGKAEDGVRTFVNYVFGDPLAWDHMTPASRTETLKGAHEWEVMLPKGTLFP